MHFVLFFWLGVGCGGGGCALFDCIYLLLPIMHRAAVQINSFEAGLFRYAGVCFQLQCFCALVFERVTCDLC